MGLEDELKEEIKQRLDDRLWSEKPTRSPPDPSWHEGNDAIWGEGNWIWCELPSCLHKGWDAQIRGSYHHKDFHKETNNDKNVLSIDS